MSLCPSCQAMHDKWAFKKWPAQRNLMARVVDRDPSDPVTVAIFEEDNV